jgi:hypothetical protein
VKRCGSERINNGVLGWRSCWRRGDTDNRLDKVDALIPTEYRFVEDDGGNRNMCDDAVRFC